MRRPIDRKIKSAKVVSDTHSFFNKGEMIVVKLYDDSDDTYLITKAHENSGIWVKRNIFRYIDQVDDGKYY